MSSPSIRRDAVLSLVLAATGAACLAVSSAQAEDQAKAAKGKEKCYGVAKAGENGCQSLSGAHTCGGCSLADYSGENWKWVPMGTCLQMGGQMQSFEGLGKLASMTPQPKQR